MANGLGLPNGLNASGSGLGNPQSSSGLPQSLIPQNLMRVRIVLFAHNHGVI